MTNQAIPEMKAHKRKQLLHHTVQDEIKAYIIEHSLKAGDPLPTELELSQQLEISRTSVREAVKSLEALGILSARTGAGLFVREFSFDAMLKNLPFGIMFALKQLSDVIEVRFYLEQGMVERVIEQVTPEQIAHLEEISRRLRGAAERGDYSSADDRIFHQVLSENIGNPILSMVLDTFWVVYQEAQAQSSIPPPRDPLETWKNHVEILKALKKRDANGMKVAMRHHYSDVLERLQSLKDWEQQGAGQKADETPTRERRSKRD